MNTKSKLTNKKFKYGAIILISSILSYYVYQSFNSDKYIYYRIGKEEVKTLIPEAIVESRDCRKFFEWQINNIPPIIPRQKCPWMNYAMERHIIMNNRNFIIPRAYLLGSSAIEEGGKDESMILLAFTYPTIEAGMGDGRNFVKFSIKALDQYFHENPNTSEQEFLKERYYHWYLHASNPKTKYRFEKLKTSIIPDMRHYLFIKGYKIKPQDKDMKYYYRDVYTKGAVENPKEFIVCDYKESYKRHCDGSFFYKGLYINAHFPKGYVKDYDNIKSNFLKFFDDWEVK